MVRFKSLNSKVRIGLKTLVIALVFSPFFSIAQNLVPNWQFEAEFGCLTKTCEFYNCVPFWTDGSSSPDYHNICNLAPDYRVPKGQYGEQWPRSGKGDVFIGVYHADFPVLARESLKSPLIHPMEIGVDYCVKFWLSAAENCHYASDGFAISFSMDSLLAPSNVQSPIVDAKITFYDQPIMEDTLNWVKFQGTFTADSAYEYVFIGSLEDPAKFTISKVNNNYFNCAAVYVDDFSVYPCSSMTSATAGEYQEVCRYSSEPVQIGEPPIPNHQYLWWPSDDLSSDTVANPELHPSKDRWYYLRVIDFTNDTTYDSIYLSAVDCDFTLPNVFSPNGDLINDEFYLENVPINSGLRIYNRWGQVVFEEFPYQNNWNGEDLNGNELTEGVYFIELINEQITGFERQAGYLHLLR